MKLGSYQPDFGLNGRGKEQHPPSILIKPPVALQQLQISSYFFLLFWSNFTSNPASHTYKSTENYSAQCQVGPVMLISSDLPQLNSAVLLGFGLIQFSEIFKLESYAK